ncbi:hypothetical protein I3842_16G014700 [Carya illinoinensis]|uniref:Uncharacterized protein n=1 Tax=Carya illinoinensis TaxID=32201 RepID=A0A922D410_CARIL|nr:hypothetical protein I3842_16G014700 [Carya illinoinensis]
MFLLDYVLVNCQLKRLFEIQRNYVGFGSESCSCIHKKFFTDCYSFCCSSCKMNSFLIVWRDFILKNRHTPKYTGRIQVEYLIRFLHNLISVGLIILFWYFPNFKC